MTAPDIRNRLLAIQRRRGKVVVIDPRRTETAALADQHLFIRPGTDALLLLAVLHTLHAEGLARPGRLGPFVHDFDGFWRCVQGFTPETAAAHTGIEAVAIRELARGFATADRAVWYGRFGVCTQEFGALGMWLIYALNIVTGNLDRPGGAMFTRPAVDLVGRNETRYRGFGRWRSRVRKPPRVRRRTAGRCDGRGDADARSGADPGHGHDGGQPRALQPQRTSTGRGTGPPGLHGVPRPLHQRDHSPRCTSFCPRQPPWNTRTTIWSSTCWRSATPPASPRPCLLPPRTRATTGKSCSSCRCA